jgi:CRP-like cAMP-binding protein
MDAGEELVSSEQPPRFAYILHEGWASAYREMSNGTRQIFDFRLPGDFLGLLSLVMHRLDYNVVALTEVVVSEVGMDKLISTFRQSPLLSEAVLWSLSRDAAIIAEHLINIGRRGAMERIVHLLIEIGYRLNQVGQSPQDSYECPLTQKDLAEALGITHVHLNRMLRQLRNDGLLSFNDHMVTLHDLPTLMRIAEFEPNYLQTR